MLKKFKRVVCSRFYFVLLVCETTQSFAGTRERGQCVCVSEREREKEREMENREREIDRKERERVKKRERGVLLGRSVTRDGI